MVRYLVIGGGIAGMVFVTSVMALPDFARYHVRRGTVAGWRRGRYFADCSCVGKGRTLENAG